MNEAWRARRAAEYPWAAAGDALYLDHAAIGPLAQSVRDALADYGLRRAEPHRLTMDDFAPVLARARATIERMIHAPAGTVALTQNTSYGLNLAAFGIPLAAGDVVLSTAGEFPANVFPWEERARRDGVVYRAIPMQGALPDEAALERALADPRVKVLTLSWVGYVTGHRFDLAYWGRACRARGITFVVDGIQGLGALPLDVVDAQVDLFACGTQKWLCSPWGTGFVYIAPALRERLRPPMVGWLSSEGTDDFERLWGVSHAWLADARRYELFTLPTDAIHGMTASLELFTSLGVPEIAAHLRLLGDDAVAHCAAHPDVRLVTPAEPARRAGLFAFAVRDVVTVSARLRAARVTHTVREGFIRLSPHWYTAREEFAHALALLSDG